MVAAKRKVVWSDEAKAQLKAAYIFILEDSAQNAKKVRADLVDRTRKLPDNPEKYPLTNTKKIMTAVTALSKNIHTGLCTAYVKMKSEF